MGLSNRKKGPTKKVVPCLLYENSPPRQNAQFQGRFGPFFPAPARFCGDTVHQKRVQYLINDHTMGILMRAVQLIYFYGTDRQISCGPVRMTLHAYPSGHLMISFQRGITCSRQAKGGDRQLKKSTHTPKFKYHSSLLGHDHDA